VFLENVEKGSVGIVSVTKDENFRYDPDIERCWLVRRITHRGEILKTFNYPHSNPSVAEILEKGSLVILPWFLPGLRGEHDYNDTARTI